MDIEYERITWKGDTEKESSSISSFFFDELLNDDEKRVHLEKQPTVVVEALGRLVSILLDKGILDLNDLKNISGCDCGRKADSLVLKKEE